MLVDQVQEKKKLKCMLLIKILSALAG